MNTSELLSEEEKRTLARNRRRLRLNAAILAEPAIEGLVYLRKRVQSQSSRRRLDEVTLDVIGIAREEMQRRASMKGKLPPEVKT